MKGFSSGCLFAAVHALVVLAAAPPLSAASWEDEFVPRGVVHSRVAVRSERLDGALDKQGDPQTLKHYLIRDEAVRDQVTGEITRQITRYDFSFGYGLSDSWNLALNLPFLQLEQTSDLATTSPDTDIATLLAELQTESRSGLGDLRLTSLHRPVFSDRNGFIWGYGAEIPSGANTAYYVDNTTFDVSNQTAAAFIFLHYAHFPALRRSRLDLRVEVKMGAAGAVTVAGGTQATLRPGNQLRVNLGWRQEFGDFGAELEMELDASRPSWLDGEVGGDAERGVRARLHLDYGNLAELETGPVGFPFRFGLQIQTLISGANVPDGQIVSAAFQFFF